jgi:hypothetical protein
MQALHPEQAKAFLEKKKRELRQRQAVMGYEKGGVGSGMSAQQR